ncbi:CaiB/BaiF CoA transferase family protein [Arthrobacter sp. Leaf69]|uniref:CaiB/BaiF CoA transferase family protein n=1 Tax=Arthrobacter sp. Leaf69 TaxID=1736232 RepID=UPI0006FFE374|nr:CoA transferase [Arthrobacter sp. Leaf69]KQN88971.1 formyl-CoA transferase [Arthrobacter sp. Leaf69]
MSTLDGLVVLDLSRYIAGPTASMMLADQGAEVIKVEPVPLGDPSRQSGPFDQGHSVYFMSANRNKRSLALDLRSSAGLAAIKKIAETADVFIENFKPGTTEKMGIASEHLLKANPRLVYCSITGFGDGPVGASMAGFDQNAQGMSGLMSVNGISEAGPMRVGVPVADSTTGLIASFAILAKLHERARTGVGGLVSTSLMQSTNFLLTYQAQKYLSLGVVAVGEGNDHPLLFPQGTFATRDGYLTIASGNERMWRQLCGALGLHSFAEDPLYSTNEGRLTNKHELRRLMEEKLAARDSHEWMQVINAAGVPCGPVLGIDEAFEHPIAEELRLAETVEHRDLGEIRVLGRPAMTGDEKWLRTAPPVLGQHSAEILSEYGVSEVDLEALISSGSVIQG